MSEGFGDVHVVVQAGGKGMRLRPATEDVPKPMLPVAGVPMVERLVRALVRAGADRLTVVTGHRGEVVRRHLEGLPGSTGRPRSTSSTSPPRSATPVPWAWSGPSGRGSCSCSATS